LRTPEELEVAELFVAKANADLAAARLLATDSVQDDAVVGFHCQQAVEKALKAVVALRSIEIPRSHDLGLLLRLLTSGGGQNFGDEGAELQALSAVRATETAGYAGPRDDLASLGKVGAALAPRRL
jgi:HEPN domain-containing protein